MLFGPRNAPSIVCVSRLGVAGTLMAFWLWALCLSLTVVRNAGAQEAGLPQWERLLLNKYEKRLVDVLQDATQGCVDCHSSQTMSNLVLSGHALEDLRTLLDGGYLAAHGPDTLLGRVTTDNPDRRMPKDAPEWNKRQLKRLTKFIETVAESQKSSGFSADEQFPRSLLEPYHSVDGAHESSPRQFISYRQLKAKVDAIFDDNWIRGDRDLFAENISAFGGADFESRFNESTRPTAAFLSALESLSRDVSSRAYRLGAGPFQDWPEGLDAIAHLRPDDLPSNQSIIDAITRIYQSVLFRDPTSGEVGSACKLLSDVGQLQDAISQRDSELKLQVTVTDPETGLCGEQTITIPVHGTTIQLQQTLVDQRGLDGGLETACRRIFAPLVSQIAAMMMDNMMVANSEPETRAIQSLGRVQLGAGKSGYVLVHNRKTSRNVSFAGIVVRSVDGATSRTLACDSAEVEIEGAWELTDGDGFKSFEDENRHKGLSTIRVALEAEEPGEYEVSLLWRSKPDNADQVLVELYGRAVEDRLAVAPASSPVEPGVAAFHYDCSDDSVPYVEFPAAFQFAGDDFIGLSNAGTFGRVTAGAVELINANEPENNFLIDSQFAAGAEDWKTFDEGRFRAYNVRGQKLHDDNDQKGRLSLRYLLSDRADDGWRADQYYKVHLYYPGKRDQESLVPVQVHAARSSPIVQVEHPQIVKADSLVRLDASKSYTVQHSQLVYQWRQVAGPKLAVDDWTQPALEFTAPRLTASELAWTSLCAALIRHPDFLFTNPPSLETSRRSDRQRLSLLRLALDLVGRPPTQSELDRLAAGAGLDELVDTYLHSHDFRDFYFHRVRLYLESQGTELQDEPARLWSYVAFEDRPFQEILTAEYTVDANFEKLSRPAHHGKTGVLTTKGFIDGKPGLPHYNYAAQVSMLFLGYVYEVPPEIVDQREGVTALGTTDPNSSCYSCHKILTPLAFQRLNWTDSGDYRIQDEEGLDIDATDRGAVDEYPFPGEGLEAFATQAVKKERFIRTMINTHVNFYFGRPMRFLEDERDLYHRLWTAVHEHDFKIRELIRAIVLSPEYLSVE